MVIDHNEPPVEEKETISLVPADVLRLHLIHTDDEEDFVGENHILIVTDQMPELCFKFIPENSIDVQERIDQHETQDVVLNFPDGSGHYLRHMHLGKLSDSEEDNALPEFSLYVIGYVLTIESNHIDDWISTHFPDLHWVAMEDPLGTTEGCWVIEGLIEKAKQGFDDLEKEGIV